MAWAPAKENEGALGALPSPDEAAVIDPEGPLVSMGTLRGDIDVLRGDLLGVVGGYFAGLPSLLRSAQTVFARSSGFLRTRLPQSTLDRINDTARSFVLF